MMATLPTTTVPQWRRRKREYRHRAGDCSRLLFVGYLPPGTRIEIRCPACGRLHVVDVPLPPPDNEEE